MSVDACVAVLLHASNTVLAMVAVLVVDRMVMVVMQQSAGNASNRVGCQQQQGSQAM
jgi:hypothetical protein